MNNQTRLFLFLLLIEVLVAYAAFNKSDLTFNAEKQFHQLANSKWTITTKKPTLKFAIHNSLHPGFNSTRLTPNEAQRMWTIQTNVAEYPNMTLKQSRQVTDELDEYQFVWPKPPKFDADEVCFYIQQNDTKWYSLFINAKTDWPMFTDYQLTAKSTHFPFTSGARMDQLIESILLNTGGFAIVFDDLHPWSIEKRFMNEVKKTGGTFCLSFNSQSRYPSEPEHLKEYFTIKFRILVAQNIRKLHDNLIKLGYIKRPHHLPRSQMFNLPLWSYLPFKHSKSQMSDCIEKLTNKSLAESGTIIEIDDTRNGAKKFTYYPTDFEADFLQKIKHFNLSLSPSIRSYVYSPKKDGTIDVPFLSNPNEFIAKLEQLMKAEANVGSFKFTAADVWTFISHNRGQFNWHSELLQKYPNFIATQFISTGAQLSAQNTYTTAYKSQNIGNFLRFTITPKNSSENAIKDLLIQALTLSMAGYQFAVPEYDDAFGLPESKLLIHFTQAAILMPGMYHSIFYWQYPDSTVLETIKKLLKIRQFIAPEMLKLANEWIDNGKPMIRPMWYAAPEDQTSYAIWDQFMLGENILFAPVVSELNESRTIYFPPGNWINCTNGKFGPGVPEEDFSTASNAFLIFFKEHSDTADKVRKNVCSVK